MDWQPYPQTKPPKAGEYFAWEEFDGEGAADVYYYTKRDGFTDENGTIDDWVTHWAEIVPPQKTSPDAGVGKP